MSVSSERCGSSDYFKRDDLDAPTKNVSSSKKKKEEVRIVRRQLLGFGGGLPFKTLPQLSSDYFILFNLWGLGFKVFMLGFD